MHGRRHEFTNSNSNFVAATRADGLYDMDLPGGSENTDLEKNELGGIEELDADVPAEIPSAEAHDARIKSSPKRPTADKVERHDATHCPYRSWCSVCVAASAKEDPHPRKDKKDTDLGVPVIDFD